MHHGGIGSVSCDHGEAVLHISLLFLTEIHQKLSHVCFRNGLTGSQLLLQAHLEPGHGHAFLDMGVFCVCDLHRVLHGLQTEGRLLSLYNGHPGILLHSQVQTVIDVLHAHQHDRGHIDGGDPVQDLPIWPHSHSVFLKIIQSLLRYTAAVHIKDCRFLGQKDIGHKGGIVHHIRGPQVQKPGNAVQAGNGHGVRPVLLKPGADLGDLFCRRKACILFRKQIDRALGDGRTVCPDGRDQILRPDPDPLGRKRCLHIQHSLRRSDHAVDPQDLSLLQPGEKKFLDGGHAFFLHTVEDDLAAGHLPLRLDKITAIGPQTALRFSDH